jgi:hypothetical protein
MPILCARGATRRSGNQLMAENLQLLISELTKLREGTTTSKQARQIREGGTLAVQLAELLQKMGAPGGRNATG